jgi:hypothetical protein
MNKNILVLIQLICTASLLNAQSIVGAWQIRNAGEAKSDAVITFLANGFYTMAEDGNSKADLSGKDGMERGTYRWNPKTKAFTRQTIVDTSGEWGLSDSVINSANVTPTKLTLSASDGKFTLTRVSSKGILGSWYLKEGKGYAVVTFLADGTYFMVQDGRAEEGGKTGMERGTYKWNPVTHAFTRKILVDTNGTWGFSDSGKLSITVSGNKLIVTDARDKATLQRVIAPE